MQEHNYGGDLRYMLECVYRAMSYASLEALSTKSVK
jgi:hypothetical protein